MAVKAGALAIAFACVASQAAALSCMQPQIERSFNWWAEAEETYYIGVGSLEPTGLLPKVRSGMTPSESMGEREPITAEYAFSGRLLNGQNGVEVSLPITVEVTCLASWCGRFPQPGKTGLMALRGTDIQNLTLEMSACPGSIFPAETEATVNACMRAGQCDEPQER